MKSKALTLYFVLTLFVTWLPTAHAATPHEVESKDVQLTHELVGYTGAVARVRTTVAYNYDALIQKSRTSSTIQLQLAYYDSITVSEPNLQVVSLPPTQDMITVEWYIEKEIGVYAVNVLAATEVAGIMSDFTLSQIHLRRTATDWHRLSRRDFAAALQAIRQSVSTISSDLHLELGESPNDVTYGPWEMGERCGTKQVCSRRAN